MGITMKEIADMCGVSRGTVDRVLNGRGKVKPETENRIRAVARSMGYRSGERIDALPANTDRSYKIGVLLNTLDHPYFAEILSGIIRALEKAAAYNITGIIRQSSGFDAIQQLALLDELKSQNVDVLICSPANSRRVAKKLTEFDALGVPVIVVSSLNDHYTPFATISCDHYSSGRIAAGFARQLLPNCKKIAMVAGSLTMPGNNMRLNGFVDVINEKCPNCVILDAVQTFDDDVIAYKALSGLVSRHRDVDLFFFAAGGYNGSYQALEDAGLLGKSRIISFDLQDANIDNLKKGYVSALFDQHPIRQGERAVKVATDYLLAHTATTEKNIYIPIEIIVEECLNPPKEPNRQPYLSKD